MNILQSWIFRLFGPLGVIAALAGLVVGQAGPLPARQPLVSLETLLSAPVSFRGPQIQALLEAQSSPLAGYAEEIAGQSFSAAELFWIASQGETYGISPRALIATFAVENNGLAWAQQGGLLEHLVPIARRLAELANQAAARPAGEGAALLSAPESNPATEALSAYLAPSAKLAGQARASLQSWTSTYQKLFGADAQEKTAAAGPPPTTVPFLRLPFEQPKEDFFKVESFFDHAVPGNFDETTLARFDGKTLPGAQFKTCWSGVTCYSGHNAIDFPMPVGTPLYAAAPGTVILRYDPEGGLIIDHGNGYRTVYWHMEKISVELNQQLGDGQALGVSGNRGMSTGPHLHFVVRISALSRDIDPYGWWAPTADPWPYPSRWLWRGGQTADNGTAQGQLFYGQYWARDPQGYGGDAYYTLTSSSFGASLNWGLWGTYLPKDGSYRVYATWPRNPQNTTSAAYQVWHAGGSTTVSVSQADDGDRWVLLGTFAFKQGPAAVILSDLTRDTPDRKRIYFDAVRWESTGGTIYVPGIPNSQP